MSVMNEHVERGNSAILRGEDDLAIGEFYLALEDSDPITQRIARNRLIELCPDRVFGSSHAFLYHRESCPAKNMISPRSRIVWFRDWKAAEAAGYTRCNQCRPTRG